MTRPTTLRTVALSQVRQHRLKLTLTAVSVAVSTFFIAAVLMINASIGATLKESVAAQYATSDAVVSAAGSFYGDDQRGPQTLSTEQLHRLHREPSLLHAWPQYQMGDMARLAHSRSAFIERVQFPDAPEFFPWSISGSTPATSGQVVVSSAFAEENGLQVGDSFEVHSVQSHAGPDAMTPVKISGIFPVERSSSQSAQQVYQGGHDLSTYISAQAAEENPGSSGVSEVMLSLRPGASGETIRQWAQSQDAGHALVYATADEQVHRVVEQLNQGNKVLTLAMLVFAGLALVMASFVISNTFTMMTIQRSRELALLRVVGATRGAILRLLLLESLVVGALAASCGVGLAYLLGMVLGPTQRVLTVDLGPQPGLVAFAVGVVVTVGVSVRPAQAAYSVSPISAITQTEQPHQRRLPRTPVALGTLMIIAGIGTGAAGAFFETSLLIILGCFVATIGSLLVFPAVLVGILRLTTVNSPMSTWRLARAQAAQSPSRTAATGRMLFMSALFISVVLMGYSTGQSTVNHTIDRYMPISISATITGQGSDGQRPLTLDAPSLRSAAEKTAQLPHVDAAQLLMPVGSMEPAQAGAGTLIVRSASVEQLKQTAPGLADTAPHTGEVLISALNSVGLASGQTVTVQGPAGSTQASVKITELSFPGALVDEATARPLGQASPQYMREHSAYPEIWVKPEAGLSSTTLSSTVSDVARTAHVAPESISGAALERQRLEQTLHQVLTAVLVLLAATIVISLVGVANTLTLSSYQRRRDNALLRTLGLSAARLGRVVTTEVMMIATVAVVLGAATGTVLGALGLQVLSVEDLSVVYSVPWLLIAVTVAVLLALTWAAVLLPASRAAKVPPISALADD